MSRCLSALSLLGSLCLLLLLLLSSADARRVRGKYYDAVVEEYRQGAIALAAIPATTPQQVLSSLGATPDQAVVTWLTFADADSSIQWGTSASNLSASAAGSSFHFVDTEPAHTLRVLHTARISGLQPGATVSYRVGDPTTGDWSANLTYTAPTAGSEVLLMIVYGDMGYVNAQSMQNVAAEVQGGQAGLVLHVGDYAYDLNTDNGAYGDIFLNNLQNISSRVPYLGVQGNHENAHNISHWKNRFTAYSDLGASSGSGTNLWFSWDVVSGGARVHFAALDTEMYYSAQYADQRAAQYAFLDRDLAKARKEADWVVVYGHRPLYCCNLDTLSDCTTDAKVLRDGYGSEGYGMDDLFHKHNVDLYLTAHEHDYERTYPIYRGQWEAQHANHTYHNAQATVHIVSGSAGCQEGLEGFDEYLYPAWSVMRSGTYGYGHLLVRNATHLYWEQLLDEGKGGLDTLWMTRNVSRKGQPSNVIVPLDTVVSS